MKKMIGMIALLLLMMGVVGCNRETVNINFPFEVGQVENIEMYHYTGVPVSAEKKVVVAETDIIDLYDKFEDLSLMEKQVEETTGGDVTKAVADHTSLMIPGEYFKVHNCGVADFMVYHLPECKNQSYRM